MNIFKQSVENKTCISCGICKVYSKEKIEFEYIDKEQKFIPSIKNQIFEDNSFCIGEEINMKRLSNYRFNKDNLKNPIGFYKNLYVGHSTNKEIRKNASSGGLAPEIVSYLLKTKKYDYAIIAENILDPKNSNSKVIDKNYNIKNSQGSIYHSVNMSTALDVLKKHEKSKIIFVGLPCQIAALYEAKMRISNLDKKEILTIGLFCGGYNKFDGFKYYLKNFLADDQINKIKNIRYRVGNFPGNISLKFNDDSHKIIPRTRNNTTINIIKYMIGTQGYWQFLRCRLCPDQVNDFADIALGDPHLKEYKNYDNDGYSIVISRTSKGQNILLNMLELKRINLNQIEENKVLESQSWVLLNRRHITPYYLIAKLLKFKTPKLINYDHFNSYKTSNYISAIVDMIKLKIPINRFTKNFFIIPFQIFEYLFLTYAPRMILKRIIKILINKKND